MTKVTKIEIRPSTLELQEGEYGLVEAYLEPANATYADIVWTTDNSNIATVNSGHIVAKKRGTTKVKAVSLCDVSVKGECTLTVIPPKRVQSISFPQDEYTIVLGRPDYIFPNFTPSDALNKDLTWCCFDENIISVTDGLVTPKAAGTTKLIAVSSDGSHTASCTVRVVLDNVIIKRIGGDTDVIFESTGKRWKCIFEDMVYNEQNAIDDRLLPRANFNLFVDPNSRPLIYNFRYFSPEEFKLLFAIDPLGVARYIQQYTDLNCKTLSKKLEKKDEFFELFFNCKPRYFTLTDEGEWVQTNNKENPEDVISESESYFGIHSIGEIDGVRILINLVELGSYVLSLISKSEKVDELIEIGGVLIKSAIYFYNDDSEAAWNEIDEYIQDAFADYIFKTDVENKETFSKLVEPVYDFLSAMNNINEILDALSDKQMYYCATIDYCVNKVDYAVRLELQNGNSYKLSHINKLISQ